MQGGGGGIKLISLEKFWNVYIFVASWHLFCIKPLSEIENLSDENKNLKSDFKDLLFIRKLNMFVSKTDRLFLHSFKEIRKNFKIITYPSDKSQLKS